MLGSLATMKPRRDYIWLSLARGFFCFFYIVSKEISLVNPEDDSKNKILILIIALKSYILLNKFNNSKKKKKGLKKIFLNSNGFR